jgi:hypothetical protein
LGQDRLARGVEQREGQVAVLALEREGGHVAVLGLEAQPILVRAAQDARQRGDGGLVLRVAEDAARRDGADGAAASVGERGGARQGVVVLAGVVGADLGLAADLDLKGVAVLGAKVEALRRDQDAGRQRLARGVGVGRPLLVGLGEAGGVGDALGVDDLKL